MRILIVGSGGREHALAWKINQSPLCNELYCLPGNAGTDQICKNVDIGGSDYPAMIRFAKGNKIDLVIVGPEQPLADGLSDMLRDAGINVVGVSKEAARLEASKAFAKDFCFRHGIPCAMSRNFDDAKLAKTYISEVGAPIVIKADGLAAGKGVVVAMTEEEAYNAVDMIMGGFFGASGERIVVEEYLEGEELSFFALCDGEHAMPFLGVQDYKTAFNGGEGPNTGGMGTYAPAPFMDSTLADKIMDKIALPTLNGMKEEGRPYSGIMFMGLFVRDGEPKLIEYNVRFGDPECQILMMLLESDLVKVFNALANCELKGFGNLNWRDDYAVNIVLASENYPGAPLLNRKITLPENYPPSVQIFHAGTSMKDNQLVNSGGRVLGVAAYGKDIYEARNLAYGSIKRIDLSGGFYRDDVGLTKKEYSHILRKEKEMEKKIRKHSFVTQGILWESEPLMVYATKAKAS